MICSADVAAEVKESPKKELKTVEPEKEVEKKVRCQVF